MSYMMNYLNSTYLRRSVNIIKNKITFTEQYECKDFILKLNNFNLFEYITKNKEINITKINDKKIPFNEQYECKDFKLK